jgi:predicted RNA-binding Zn ribbon-like protein
MDAADVPAIPLKKKEALAPSVPAIKAVPDPAPAPVARAAAPAPRKADAFNRRAAFTLRLDAKRHLKLRLASTVRNRSAQQLVTEALDRFLNDIPEIEALAAQVQRD